METFISFFSTLPFPEQKAELSISASFPHLPCNLLVHFRGITILEFSLAECGQFYFMDTLMRRPYLEMADSERSGEGVDWD